VRSRTAVVDGLVAVGPASRAARFRRQTQNPPLLGSGHGVAERDGGAERQSQSAARLATAFLGNVVQTGAPDGLL
jgi:hypothetical protein